MNVAEPVETRPRLGVKESPVRLPFGLLGFEHIKEFVLVANPNEEPFMWLQVKSDPNLAFLVLSPFAIAANYQPDISAEDTTFLGIKEAGEALLLCVVTMRNERPPTINLKGPLVLNRRTLVGKQVIPTNAASFPVAYPLPATAA